MKFSPTEFWNLTLKEAELIVKGDRKRQENEFMLNVYANMNGIGLTMGGKKFKFQNPFKGEKMDDKPKRTREELLAELDDVKRMFNAR